MVRGCLLLSRSRQVVTVCPRVCRLLAQVSLWAVAAAAAVAVAAAQNYPPEVLKNMNLSASPCDDFYGAWLSHHRPHTGRDTASATALCTVHAWEQAHASGLCDVGCRVCACACRTLSVNAEYACGGWIASTVLPPTEDVIFKSISTISARNEDIMAGILTNNTYPKVRRRT